MMHLGMDYNAVQAVSEYQFFGLVYSWLMGDVLFWTFRPDGNKLERVGTVWNELN